MNFSTGVDGVHWTDFGAGSATGTKVGVDNPGVVLLADCFNGAFGLACAAVDAFAVY